MTDIPGDQHITYQLQHRKCGKASCSTCRNGQGHGPYWYAYWREGSRLRSGYVGKVHPNLQAQSLPSSASTKSAHVEPGKAGSSHTEPEKTGSSHTEQQETAGISPAELAAALH